MEIAYMQVGAQQGWQCPLCKRIYGPFVQECLRCNNVEMTLKIGDVNIDEILKKNETKLDMPY